MNDAGQLLAALGSLGREVPNGARLVGVGWATVDLERTLAGLPGATGTSDPVGGADLLVDEPALGARARVVAAGGLALVVLEPSTEGRLAAALARRGEGIACLYVEGDRPVGGRQTALGRSGRLLPHDRPWGPFVILLGPTDQGSVSP